MSEIRREIIKFSIDQKISKSTTKLSDLFFNIMTLGAMSVAKQAAARYLRTSEKRIEDLAGLTKNDKSEEYAICFGYLVKQHAEIEFKNKIYATQRDAIKSNVITPILLNDDILRQHVQIIGTTGSGKTQLLKGVLEQQIARGGGAFAIFGKADNVMLQQLYAVAVEYGREQDFFVIDWTATKEQVQDSIKLSSASVLTNSINMFDLGTVDDVINAMIKIAGLDNTNDKWESASKDYLSAVLRILASLKDADLSFDIDKIDEILEVKNTFDALIKEREELSFYTLSEIITNIEKTFKMILLIEKIYMQDRDRFEKHLYKIANDNISYSETTKREDLHRALKQTIEQQINGITVDYVLNCINDDIRSGFESMPKNDKMFYKLEISQSQLGSLISFYEKFALILKNKKSDFSFVEAFRSGKIVIFNVPGQESEDAKIIGKTVMAILNLIVKKQGKAPKSKETFLGIFDEINSWAKGQKESVFGLGDILSVVRGLGIAGIVAHQSSLDSMGKSTSEKEQIQANINTKIVLKTESSDILRELNELVGKKEVKYKKDKIKNKQSRSDEDTDVKEEFYFKKQDLGSLWSGQGYLIRNKVIEKMITYYLENKRYSEIDEETISIAKTIDIDSLKAMI